MRTERNGSDRIGWVTLRNRGIVHSRTERVGSDRVGDVEKQWHGAKQNRTGRIRSGRNGATMGDNGGREGDGTDRDGSDMRKRTYHCRSMFVGSVNGSERTQG